MGGQTPNKRVCEQQMIVATASINRLTKTNGKLRVNRTEIKQWLSECLSGQQINVSMIHSGYDMQSR